MCGIAGIMSPELSEDFLSGSIRSMCDAVVHLGPDDHGCFVERPVALGMRRLSIIDVTGGKQPVSNEDYTVQGVFNGEIEKVLLAHRKGGDDLSMALWVLLIFELWRRSSTTATRHKAPA